MIDPAYLEGFEPYDRVLCDLIQRLAPTDDPWIRATVALLSRVCGEGHVCLDLTQAGRQVPDHGLQDLLGPRLPSSKAWRQRLLNYPAVGRPGAFRPLILDGPRLYLHRYWHHENRLAKALLRRCSGDDATLNGGDLGKALARCFPGKDAGQQKAAVLAATRTLAVISGGPGTGKTHTLARIILMLQHLLAEKPLRIKLAAPTGKAAARMQESLHAAVEHLVPRNAAAELTVPEAQTLHRLLGIVPGAGHGRYHADHRLVADVVIVDEASMIDLALMARLVEAVPDQARLIITGDKDQLASVEAGAVLGDICSGLADPGEPADQEIPAGNASPATAAPDNSLKSHIVVLRKNYRFSTASGLGALSRAINTGSSQEVLRLLDATGDRNLMLQPACGGAALADLLQSDVEAAYGPLMRHTDARQAVEQLNRLKILTVVRQGPYGVRAVNQLVERILFNKGFLPALPAREPAWYAGRPVLITRNDYFHNLFNGDMGVTLFPESDQEREGLRVAFADHLGQTKYLAPYQVPPHETVYAMTVHKSQGSEFDRVILVLPDQDLPILTRELLYTAVTRARTSLLILGDPDVLSRGLARRVVRASGLRAALWPDSD